MPFVVCTWRSIGRSQVLTSSKTLMSDGRSCPSVGPTQSRPNCSNMCPDMIAAFAISPVRWYQSCTFDPPGRCESMERAESLNFA